MRDLTSAFRSLGRSPGFSLTAVIALALGIGAATTVFSVTDHLLFRKLPYSDPAALVSIGADVRAKGQSNWAVYPDEYDAWKSSIRSLSELTGFQTFGRFTVSKVDAPIELSVNRVTPNFLRVLGVAPALGRQFAEADYVPGAPVALLLTDRTWRRDFGADEKIVGQFLTVNGAPGEIAGVLPRTFAFPSEAGFAQPESLVPLVRTKETSFSRIRMIGRLAPGIPIETARSEIDALAAARAGESGMRNARIDGATVKPLDEALGQHSGSVLRLFLGAVAVLLLIGCANVANLLLARGADRAGELAVRMALGASRLSLIRLLLTETAILATMGGLTGAALAYVATATLGSLIPADLRRLGEAAVDGRALLFAAITSGLVVLIAGLGPAVTAARHISPALARVSTRTTGVRWRARQVLVGLEVALAVVLLVAGALMVGSMVRVLGVDSGYTSRSLLTMRVQLPTGKEYPKRSKEFIERVIASARSVPGVGEVGASENVPLSYTLAAGHYRVEGFPYEWMGRDRPKGVAVCCSQTQWISTGYLPAAGIRISRGRSFSQADAAGAPAVALIDEHLARRFPAGMDPIGHYLTSAEENSTDQPDRRVIVGIVHDVRDLTLESEGLPTIYLPMEERGTTGMTLMLRTSVAPESVGGSVQKAIRQGAGPVLITDVRTFDDVMKRSVASRHLNAWLFGSFGILGLLLAAVGIASIVSYSVARRTREIGVRMALGAQPADVRRLVVFESMTPVAVGLVVGVAVALLLSRLAESFLFQIAPRDVSTYVGVSAVLLVVSVMAASLPAGRASRVDPLVALRSE